MRTVSLTLVLLSALLLPGLCLAQEEGEGNGPSAKLSDREMGEDQLSRYFRMGFHGYGVFTGNDPNIDSLLGAGVQLPLTANVWNGLGFRFSFYGHYQKQDEMSLRWRSPDPAYGDQDEVWEVGEKPAPLMDGSTTELRRLGHNALYSLTTDFYFELSSAYSPVLQVWQPFVGVGPMLVWLFTYTDIQANEVYLIDNEWNDVDDPNNVDPFAIQFLLGFNAFGGFHFNLGRSFRISIELGYVRIDVPEAELRKVTPGYEAQHLGYNLNIFRFGGGLSWRL